jgi:multicomponent K+:H+ antiporter subunit D
VYAIARVYTLVFGEYGGPLAGVAAPWLPWLALCTLALGALGALAAGRLRGLVAYAVVGSAGTLLLALGLAERARVAAAMFYLVDSTLVAAALFLLVDRIQASRELARDRLNTGAALARPATLGVAFFVLGVAAAGLPPTGGFIGKAMLLSAAASTSMAVAAWSLLLLAGLGMVVAIARAGSVVFWERATGHPSAAAATPGSGPEDDPVPDAGAHALAIAKLGAALVAVAAFAGPLAAYSRAAADQLFSREAYLRAVLGAEPVPPAFDVRREMRERAIPKESGR